MAEDGYSRQFFADHAIEGRRSAEAVVPLVLELVEPRSVVDLGCGAGVWLAAFARHGVDDILGVDGDWVPDDVLEIPREHFVSSRLDQPLRLDRRFDLAVSLEVAEHLPESAARQFVETVVGLAPCVLFSAAVPQQGGRQHLNEQWPDYWAALFGEHGYVVVDAIRPVVWSNPRVTYWYRQNTLLYVREDVCAGRPALARARERTLESMLSLVHPELLARAAAEPDEHVRRRTAREHSLRELVYASPYVVGRSLRARLGRIRRRG
jgi:SAM-dependent methyltransferase